MFRIIIRINDSIIAIMANGKVKRVLIDVLRLLKTIRIYDFKIVD